MSKDNSIATSLPAVKLPASFYQRSDVVEITKDLIGKVVVTNFNGEYTSGRIVEAEAYNGPFDKAAHS